MKVSTTTGHERLRLPADDVHGTYFAPREPRRCGVVVIAGSGGGDVASTGMARALAEAGFPSLGLGYFKVPGGPDELRDIPLEYFARAVEALRARLTAGSPVVALGSSRGSEAALLLASHFAGAVDGVVAVVPADAAFGSWPPGGAAWTLAGEPLPPATAPGTDHPADVAIPIERFGGPTLLVSAGADEVWPSAAMASALEARLAQAARPGVHLTYPEATHALSFVAPYDDDSQLAADVAARGDAWPKVIEFLDRRASSVTVAPTVS